MSLCLHGCVLGALVILFHTVPQMHLPDAIYSVKILRPVMSSLGARGPAGAAAKSDAVKVDAPKQEAKKPPKQEPKVAVPKKPDKAAARKETAKEGEGAAADKPMGVMVGAGAGDGTGIAVDAARFPFSYYLSAIESRVSDNWYSAVSESGAGLTCVVYFRLKRDGSVEDVRVETGSGNGYFDRAAIRAVKSAAPFPPLPRGFPDDFLGIHFTFVQKE